MSACIKSSSAVILISMMALAIESIAWAQDPKLVKAEAVYRDVYGTEHDKAVAGTAAVKIAFAKKLLLAAAQVGDDPSLKTVILSKALKIAVSAQGGTKTGLDIYVALAGDPQAKLEHAGEYAALLEKSLTVEPPAGKAKMAADLVGAYPDWANEQARRGDAAAGKSLLRAREVARLYIANSKDLLQEIDEQVKVVERNVQQNKDLAKLTDLLRKDPKHADANLGLALIDCKSGDFKKAAERLALVNVKELNHLGKALREASPSAREVAVAAFIAAGAIANPTYKAGLLELARTNYEKVGASGKFDALAAREHLGVLMAILPLEAGSARHKTAERMALLTVDVANDVLEGGDADGAAQLFADARAACKRYPGLQNVLVDLDAQEKDFKSRFEFERERAKYAEMLKSDPADAKANWGMALVLLREGRPIDASPYLLKNEKPEIRKLGDMVKSANLTDFEKGEALRTAANGMAALERSSLLYGARVFYESLLEKNPQHAEAGRVRLILGQIPESPFRRGLPAGVVALFDQSKKDIMLKLLIEKGEGNSKASLDDKVKFLSASSLKITPGWRHVLAVPGWSYPVVQNPQAGQFRYIAFAWKKEGGGSVALCVRGGDGRWRGFAAGDTNESWTKISKTEPSEWTLVTRDLFKEFGAFDIVGFGMVPIGGTAGYCDAVYIGRTEADVKRAATSRR